MSSENVAIYLGFSDLGGFIVESCHQIVDNKVTFGVVSVKYSEGGKVQTQSRKAAEKYFFKCPIKTQFIVESYRQIVDNKVTFWVVSVNHSEVDKVQTQSRTSAEKYFFKCPIKTQRILSNFRG